MILSCARNRLTDLGNSGLKFTVDFRQVHATVLQDWLGGVPAQILNSQFQNSTSSERGSMQASAMLSGGHQGFLQF